MIIRISGTSHKSDQKSANNEWDLTKNKKRRNSTHQTTVHRLLSSQGCAIFQDNMIYTTTL